MPTYEYECVVCNNEFEVQQSIKEEAGVDCPSCKVFCCNRLISKNTTFTLKGECWAVDNYSSSRKG